MYNLYGLKENIRNICLLSKKYCPPRLESMADLKKAYIAFLGDYQPACPHPSPDLGFFVQDQETEDAFAELFRTEAKLDDRQQSKLLRDGYTPSEVADRIAVTQGALDQMKQDLPETFQLFSLAINSIFFRKAEGAGGGSTSNATGVIWSNCRTHWSRQDILEVLLHEMTHNLVFLDELCHLHYTDYDEVTKEENYALSAILKIRRPLDKVVHSIVVATEILSYRRSSLGNPTEPKAHPPTPLLWEQTIRSADSVLSDPNTRRLLTDRSSDILIKCRESLESDLRQDVAV